MERELKDNPVGLDAVHIEHLARIFYWDGGNEQEIRLTSAVTDLSIDVGDGAGPETWTGSGIFMSVSGVDESVDLDAPGMDIIFDGVDTTISAIIMGNDFRGRQITIWRVWIDPTTGLIKSPGTGPIQLFDGFQDEGYIIGETLTDNPDLVSVSTRAVGLMSRVVDESLVKTNVTSHNEMLERAGLSTGDTAMQNVVAIAGVEIFWGRKGPAQITRIRQESMNPGDIVPQGRGA